MPLVELERNETHTSTERDQKAQLDEKHVLYTNWGHRKISLKIRCHHYSRKNIQSAVERRSHSN